MSAVTPAELATEFISCSREVLREGMRKIEHCVAQLTDDQLWWRPRPEMNSIANLILHQSGNLRQWLVAGVTGSPDNRNRPQEFADRSQRTKAELLKILKGVVDEADAVLSRLTPEEFVAPRRIQGFDATVASAILHTVPHFRGHTQEIIHITREQLGDRYQFDFVPQGAEQTAASGAGL